MNLVRRIFYKALPRKLLPVSQSDHCRCNVLEILTTQLRYNQILSHGTI